MSIIFSLIFGLLDGVLGAKLVARVVLLVKAARASHSRGVLDKVSRLLVRTCQLLRQVVVNMIRPGCDAAS